MCVGVDIYLCECRQKGLEDASLCSTMSAQEDDLACAQYRQTEWATDQKPDRELIISQIVSKDFEK